MNKISGKKLNLLKTLEILKSNQFVSFYHFNNLSKKEWDTIKLQLRKIETQDIPSNESEGGDKEKKGRTQVLPLLTAGSTRSNLLLERTALVLPRTKSNLLLKQVPSNSNKLVKGVTTKRKLKGAEVELLVLKSKAVVKALYPFLFYSQSCLASHGVEQTVHTYPLALRGTSTTCEASREAISKAISKAIKQRDCFATEGSDPLSTTVATLIGDRDRDPSHGHGHGHTLTHKQSLLNVSDSLLPEKSACYLRSANNQLGFTLNPVPAARINSLINAFYLIEGPTLLVGASTIEGFKESARQLEKEKSLVFVGGVLENQFINHLDLKDCLKTSLPTSANLLQTLNYPLMIPPLNYYSNKLLFSLKKRQESLKKEEL